MTKPILTIVFVCSLLVFSSDLKAQQTENNQPKLATSSKATTSSTTVKEPAKLATSDSKSESSKVVKKKKTDSKTVILDSAPKLGTSSKKEKNN